MRARTWIRIIAGAPGLALLAQLLLASVAAAASGGGDWPVWRR